MKKQLLDVFTGGAKANKTLGAIELHPSRFAIYVPSRLKDHSLIEPRKRYDTLVQISREFLYQKLGGLTCYNAQGYWRDGNSGLHAEDTLVMESFCDMKKLLNAAFSLRQFANALAIEFDQATMACVVDGEMVFFNPSPAYRKKHEDTVLDTSKRKTGSVVWKNVLAPLKAAGVKSIYGKIA